MQSLSPLLLALLVASNATLAEPPTDASIVGDGADHRILLAQAQPSDAPPERTDTGKRTSQRAPTEDESLALAALEGLMAQPPERALPILKKVLAGQQSALVKRRALFVLSQIDSSEAQTILVDTAKSPNSELRAEAIRNIGIGGEPKSLAVLQGIYNGGDQELRKQVLHAWLISGSKNEVYQAALNAKSDEEANEAIKMLGVMGATDELRKLSDLKKPGHDFVDAYAISGDLAGLRRIAEGNGDVDARREAIRKIGIIDSTEARAALREIYTKSKDAELKRAALDGMLISGDEQGVLSLYRSAQNADDKRDLLRTLSHINGDAALEAIDAALEGKQ
jgi:HEAT repeat protein